MLFQTNTDHGRGRCYNKTTRRNTRQRGSLQRHAPTLHRVDRRGGDQSRSFSIPRPEAFSPRATFSTRLPRSRISPRTERLCRPSSSHHSPPRPPRTCARQRSSRTNGPSSQARALPHRSRNHGIAHRHTNMQHSARSAGDMVGKEQDNGAVATCRCCAYKGGIGKSETIGAVSASITVCKCDLTWTNDATGFHNTPLPVAIRPIPSPASFSGYMITLARLCLV
jgi:hypothetical protein